MEVNGLKGTLTVITRELMFRQSEVLLELCLVLMRLHLEYCTGLSPYIRNGITALEEVQRDSPGYF